MPANNGREQYVKFVKNKLCSSFACCLYDKCSTGRKKKQYNKQENADITGCPETTRVTELLFKRSTSLNGFTSATNEKVSY